jgi:FSR family fosmidomycin resistance protein-like MFS transporter
LEKHQFKSAKVITISSSHFLHDVYSSFLPPLLPLIISKYGISLSMASWLSLIQRIPSLFSIILGGLAHHLKWRWIIIFAPLITAFAGSFLGLAPNILILGILLFTMGLSSAAFHVPAPVMIKYYSGGKAGQGMSYYMLGGELARMIGPVLVVSAVSWWGFEGIWRLFIPAALAAILIAQILENIPYEKNSPDTSVQIHWWTALTSYKGFFISLAFYMIFRSLMKASLSTFLPTYMGLKGNSLLFGAFSLSVLQITGALGAFLSGGISDRLGRFSTLFLLALLSPIALFLFVTSGTGMQIFALLLGGIVLFGSTPVLLALVQEQGSEHPALMNGSFTTINFISSALAVVVAGYAGDAWGLDLTYKVSALLGIGAIPAVYFLKQYSQTNQKIEIS